MDWLLLAALGIMWVAFLLPTGRRTTSPSATVEDFEHRMELLAQAEVHGSAGRWIITPRKGARFVGTAERSRARARERRRRVLTFLLEAIGITFLIGSVPPLRLMWTVSAALAGLLLVYVWLLISIKQRTERPGERVAAAQAPAQARRPAAERFVADGGTRTGWARPTLNGLGLVGEGDSVHVVVKSAAQAGAAGY